MTPRRSCATTKIIRRTESLNGYLRANRRMRFIAGKNDVVKTVIEERMRPPFEA
jgi:hypothetical protein